MLIPRYIATTQPADLKGGLKVGIMMAIEEDGDKRKRVDLIPMIDSMTREQTQHLIEQLQKALALWPAPKEPV